MRAQPKSPREEFNRAIDLMKKEGKQVEITQPPQGSKDSIHAGVKVDGSSQAWCWDCVYEEWK